jgi:LPXTG-site transpeptidase (sortase) family protein
VWEKELALLEGSCGRLFVRLTWQIVADKYIACQVFSAWGTALGHNPGNGGSVGRGQCSAGGHRDTFFRGLSRVRLHEVIELGTLRGTFKYRVERITVVGPQDVQVVQSPEWDLTLVTCFPFHYVGPAPQRYIVQGTRVAADKT